MNHGPDEVSDAVCCGTEFRKLGDTRSVQYLYPTVTWPAGRFHTMRQIYMYIIPVWVQARIYNDFKNAKMNFRKAGRKLSIPFVSSEHNSQEWGRDQQKTSKWWSWPMVGGFEPEIFKPKTYHHISLTTSLRETNNLNYFLLDVYQKFAALAPEVPSKGFWSRKQRIALSR